MYGLVETEALLELFYELRIESLCTPVTARGAALERLGASVSPAPDCVMRPVMSAPSPVICAMACSTDRRAPSV